MTKREQTAAYLLYIYDHRANVQRVWELIAQQYRASFSNPAMGKQRHRKMCLRIAEHDLSKFSAAEFEPYRRHFYPADGEIDNRDEFRAAVEHHYARNDHHPRYWEIWSITTMPKYAIVEMLIDWAAMAIVKGGSVADFYNRIRPTIYKATNSPTALAEISHCIPIVDRAVVKIRSERGIE